MRPITEEDLAWWLDLSTYLPFGRAVTYEESAPHSYIVRDRDLSSAQMDRAIRVIHSYGQPQAFHGKMGIYLIDEERHLKWWTQGMGTGLHGVINQADSRVTYGSQAGLPILHTAGRPREAYDGLSTFWDGGMSGAGVRTPASDQAAMRAVFSHAPARALRTTDLGAGTGAAMDLGIAPAPVTLNVDSSAGMLNHLLMRRPSAAYRLLDMNAPGVIQDVLVGAELVTAIGGSASYLTRETLRTAVRTAGPGTLFVLQTYAAGSVPTWTTSSAISRAAADVTACALVERYHGTVHAGPTLTTYSFEVE